MRFAGANPGAVRRMVLRESLGVTLVGLSVGAMAAFMTTHVMSSLLFDVSPRDPAIFGATVAVIAAYLPARRATTLNPLIALKYE